MNNGSHDGKVAVVTGAAGSIGSALCTGLAERGARVVAVDVREPASVVEQLTEAGGECAGLRADISSEQDVAALPGAVKQQFGHCDILVNAAGIGAYMPFRQADYATWRQVLSVNLDGQFLMCKAFVPGMIERRWGRIVNVSSTSLHTSTPGLTSYMASKGGVLGLTSALANDLAEYGITVNAVSPSYVPNTGLGSDYSDPDHPKPPPAMPEEMEQFVIGAQAIKRLSTPRDMVGLVLFLSSDDAAFVTAQFMAADGGLTRL
jgi:NAD(P)-dependent dehydrogenase (short-subunit alcohol dehydrogenase family)